MTAITPLGAYARYVSTVRTLASGQNTVDQLTQQLASGKKSQDLKGYGPESERLLKLRTELVHRQAYITAADTATTRVKAADLVLERLNAIATDLTSTTLMPTNPGAVRVDRPVNNDEDKMKITVNEALSAFKVKAEFTVSAIPSEQGPNTFDITVSDGLGGRAAATLNLDAVPPGDGLQHQFRISGGPGDGALVNLTFDDLQSASSSRFAISWPDVEPLKERTKAYMAEVRNLLNERVGDRFIFAGNRFDTEPVANLDVSKQVTRITLDGGVGRAGDRYDVVVDDRVFTYTTTGAEPSLSAVASAIASQLIQADPAVPAVITSNAGIITLAARNLEDKFAVSTTVVPGPVRVNDMTAATTTSTAYDAAPPATQVDAVTMVGPTGDPNLDIGDKFTLMVHLGDPDDPFNAKYYQENPTAPKDRPPYQEFAVSYTVTRDDFVNNGVTTVTAVAGRLATLVNTANPPFPVTAADSGTGVVTLTATQSNQPFTTTPTVRNGALSNTASVATLPPDIDSLADTAIVDEPGLPYYDSEFIPNGSKTAAWDKTVVTIDDSLKMTYGIVSNDPAFQRLIAGLRAARAATERPGEFRAAIETARDLFVRAKDEIRVIQGRNASNLATMEITKDAHLTARAGVTEQIARIEGVDKTDVSARLSNAITGLEASYTVAARTQQLKLINFLT